MRKKELKEKVVLLESLNHELEQVNKRLLDEIAKLSKGKESCRKMIVSFDFDHTMDVKSEPYPAIGKENTLMLNVIKTHIFNDDIIILETMREGDELEKAIDWLDDRGIVPDAVNDNCEQQKSYWNNNPRKISCDIRYDDKNVGWGSESVREILRERDMYCLVDAKCYNCVHWCERDNDRPYNICRKQSTHLLTAMTGRNYWCKDWWYDR